MAAGTTADELAVIVDLARRTALALDNAQLHEERRAATDTLQQALLPPALPRVDGVRFAAEYIPAIGTVDVGGDFYDVLEMPDGRWLMVLGDVSGKGVAAAAVTGLVRNVMRVLVREGRPVTEILVRINEELAEQGSGRFATLAVAAVDGRRADRAGRDLTWPGTSGPSSYGRRAVRKRWDTTEARSVCCRGSTSWPRTSSWTRGTRWCSSPTG